MKEPRYILKNHSDWILCSTILKDGRFVTGSSDNLIIIYNKETFKPDIIIQEHDGGVYCVIQLNSGELASCSKDNTIKIYKINENEYKIIQSLTEHNNLINKIIELKNGQLVSCSYDKNIIFYNKVNNQYKKKYSLTTNGINGPIIQTKVSEICYHEYVKGSSIIFFDLNDNKMINKINNISLSNFNKDCLLKISEDLLIICGVNTLSIVNVNLYKLIKIIDVFNSGHISASCILNENMILTGDENKRILQWKIEDDNLKLISKKENAHNDKIFTLLKIGNNSILSGSKDKIVKIW